MDQVEVVGPGLVGRHAEGPAAGPRSVYQSPEMSKAESGTEILTGVALELLLTSSRNSAQALGCAIRDSLSARIF